MGYCILEFRLTSITKLYLFMTRKHLLYSTSLFRDCVWIVLTALC